MNNDSLKLKTKLPSALVFILLALACLIPALGLAQDRKPAVLPGVGLSIDQYEKVAPENAGKKGFDFSHKDQSETSPKALIEEGINRTAQTQQASLPILFGLIILSLPFVVWFGLMYRLPGNKPDSAGNTVNLEDFKESRKNVAAQTEATPTATDGNGDYPKAS